MGYVWWKNYDIAKHTWKVIESWNFGLMLNDNLGEKIQNNIKWRQFFFFSEMEFQETSHFTHKWHL